MYPAFFKWFQAVLAQYLDPARMTVKLDDFLYSIDIFNNWTCPIVDDLLLLQQKYQNEIGETKIVHV